MAIIAGVSSGGIGLVVGLAIVSAMAWVGTAVTRPEQDKKYGDGYVPTIWRGPFNIMKSLGRHCSNMRAQLFGGIVVTRADSEASRKSSDKTPIERVSRRVSVTEVKNNPPEEVLEAAKVLKDGGDLMTRSMNFSVVTKWRVNSLEDRFLQNPCIIIHSLKFAW